MTDPPISWIEISVEVAAIDAEIAADIMRQACNGGVAVEHASRFDIASDSYVVDGDKPAVVKGYLKAGAEASRVQNAIRLALGIAALQRPARWRRSRRLRDESWRDSWKKHFGVLHIGRALVIKPSWTTYRRRDQEIVLEIDPGMAFGTGQHPTTGMCLRALEDRVRHDSTVLDLGCGSGILAIAAARLGARRVLALDIDPQAVKAARENVIANAVTETVELREGTLDAASAELSPAPGNQAFDIIVANISSTTLERLAPALARILAPGGTLIASGFLEDAVSLLSEAFIKTGLKVESVVDDGVWRAIIARH